MKIKTFKKHQFQLATPLKFSLGCSVSSEQMDAKVLSGEIIYKLGVLLLSERLSLDRDSVNYQLQSKSQ